MIMSPRKFLYNSLKIISEPFLLNSIFAPSIGTIFGVLLLVIMSFLFEAKRPADENEMRFKGAMFSGITTGISFLVLAYAHKNQLFAAENLPIFVVLDMLQILIGIVQPYLYIMSKENLKTYALNLLAIHVVQPVRKISICFIRSNQVEDLPL